VSGTGTTDTVAITVHGVAGAVDLAVPLGAGIADVAREYAAQCGLPRPPAILTRTGQQLPPDASLDSVRVQSGTVLVAAYSGHAQVEQARAAGAAPASGATASGGWLRFTIAAVVAGLSALLGAGASDGTRTATAIVLGAAALLGVLPVGRFLTGRAATAPAFAGAAAYVLAWEPGTDRYPLVVAVAALAAACGAGIARALTDGRTEVHDVWIASGLTVFAVAGGGVLLELEPRVGWAVLLALAVLASRFVPAFAIDVPDQLLIDLERLAVNAWSARDRTTGKRGRVIVPQAGVAELLARAAYLVNAACAAIVAVVVIAAPSLVFTATTDVDRQGALAVLSFAGGCLLLVARSYRHAPARILLRLAGGFCWLVLSVSVAAEASDRTLMYVAFLAVLLAGGVLVAAIATGRGWRSVWWARKAEVAETLCGAGAVASVVVASGLFRLLWE